MILATEGRWKQWAGSREIFHTKIDDCVLIERWRNDYNTKRPHNSLGYWPPVQGTVAASTELSSWVDQLTGACQEGPVTHAPDFRS